MADGLSRRTTAIPIASLGHLRLVVRHSHQCGRLTIAGSSRSREPGFGQSSWPHESPPSRPYIPPGFVRGVRCLGTGRAYTECCWPTDSVCPLFLCQVWGDRHHGCRQIRLRRVSLEYEGASVAMIPGRRRCSSQRAYTGLFSADRSIDASAELAEETL